MRMICILIGGMVGLLLLASSGCGESSISGSDTSGMNSGDMNTPGVNIGGSDNSALFAASSVIDFNLVFTDAEWAKLIYIHDHPPKDNMQPKEYVHCGFEFRGVLFPDAACRPKASPELWHEEQKPQFAIRFDHWNSKGRFYGLRRINFEANQYNPAPVRDRLAMWLMQKAGLHTPRVNHARVLKNGQYFGLYMNIEQIDKEFIEYQFKDSTGNLYSQGRELETNKKANDYSRIQKLWDLVELEPLNGNHANFFVQLDQLLDMPTMLRLTAAEVVLPTGDNWSNGSSNYYYYDDPLTQRFVMMPWDLDTLLDYASPPNADIYAFWGIPGAENTPNKTLQLVYQNAAWKKEFADNLVELRDGAYKDLSAQVTMVCDQIRPFVATDPHAVGPVSAMDKDCQAIRDGIATRRAYIKMVLGR